MTSSEQATFVEQIEVRGHIIDSLILPKILDCITKAGASFRIKDISIGHAREDSSFALVEIRATSQDQLDNVLAHVIDHGARPVADQDCHLVAVDIPGTFPEGFYSTTNQRTEVRVAGQWIQVDEQEMDCGVAVDMETKLARCVPMVETQAGQQFVVGHGGTRVFPHDRQEAGHGFEFMNSAVSTEKPKGLAIASVAEHLFEHKANGGKSVLVGGPAIVHTGSSPHLCELIKRGYIDTLLAGNALATHDIERALFGTSLGVDLDDGMVIEAGHEHHLRSINRIRRAGGIKQAVDNGTLTQGIMYECVKNDVDFLLAGSIRDDGPLPDVITDAIEAQNGMRERLRDATFCLMVATTLHSIAVGNLLPAWVHVVCVDINPSTVIKLNDRGSFQTVGIVTDVAPFMSQLVRELDKLEAQA